MRNASETRSFRELWDCNSELTMILSHGEDTSSKGLEIQGMDSTHTCQRVQTASFVFCWTLSLALAAIMTFVGCERSGSISSSNPEREANYQRARELYAAQDFQGAAEFYKKALSVNPEFAAAHLELGQLCEDKLGDPITAIYHYREFLELRPDSNQRQLVEDFIERAKLSLTAKLSQSPLVDPGELTQLQNEKAALLQENASLRTRIADLQKANGSPSEAAAAPTRTAPPPASPAAVAAAPEPPPGVVMAAAAIAPISDPLATTPAVRTYVVQRGDTLQSLALRYYGSRSAWEKIYQANRSGLPSKDQLKVGQQLIIP